MPPKSTKLYSLEKPSIFALALLVSFFFIFGVASLIVYNVYKHAVNNTIRSNETRTNLMAKIMLEHQRAAIGVVRSYSNRPLLANFAKKKDFEEAAKQLADLVKNNPEVERAFVADTGGTLWANYPLHKATLNHNFSSQDWYKGVSREWSPYVSSVYKKIIGGEDLAVSICAPIFDEKRKVVGIIGISQSTDFFRKIILDNDVKITLIDKARNIIYNNRFPDRIALAEYPPFEFVKKAMDGEKGDVKIRDSTDADQIKYISFAPIEGIGWSIILEKTRSEVFRSILVYLVQIAVISSLIFILVAFFLVYSRERHKQMTALKNQTMKLQESENRLRLLTSQLLTAQETERKRISMELHDDLGQALIALKLRLASVQRKLRKDQKVLCDEYEYAQKDIEQIIENVRRLSQNLSPHILENLGLSAALRWLVEDFAKYSKFGAKIDIPDINNFGSFVKKLKDL